MDFQSGRYCRNLHKLFSRTFYIHKFGHEWGSNESNSKVTHGWYECSTIAGFMEWEVQVALKQMAPLKTPSPNSMPPLFYQNYWNLVGCDITKTIPSYLNTTTLPHPINHTFITLIPKIKNPQSISEYRPISLCNVLCKKISKVLANRLKFFFFLP